MNALDAATLVIPPPASSVRYAPAPIFGNEHAGDHWLFQIGPPGQTNRLLLLATKEWVLANGEIGAEAYCERLLEHLLKVGKEHDCEKAKHMLWATIEKYRRGKLGIPRNRVSTSFYSGPDDLMEPEAGRTRLSEEVIDYITNPRHKAIFATAGIGKTTAVVSAICASVPLDQIVHIYAPTLKLCREIAAKFTRPAIVIAGRRKRNCAQWETVEKVGKAGLPIAETVCKSCPDRPDCAYWKQFNSTANIVIRSHQSLFIENDELVKKPDFIVVDEKISHLLTHEILFTENDFVKLSYLDYPLTSREPILGMLKKLHLTPEKLKREAWSMQQAAITDFQADPTAGPKLSPEYRLLLALAEEMERVQERGPIDATTESACVVKVSKGWAVTSRRIPLLSAPTLFLDATGDQVVQELITPGIDISRIAVRRNCVVTQVTDVRISKWAFLSDEKLRDRVKSVLGRYAHVYEKALVITYMDALPFLKDKVPHGWAIEYFGNIRGIDKYKDFEAVFLIGRNEPGFDAVERQAAALGLVVSNPGKHVDVVRTFPGHAVGRPVRCHLDARAQSLIEQIRESESIQAIDRLRLVGREKPGHVFILCSIPLPGIVPDHLTTLDDLAAGGSLLERLMVRFEFVLPLQPKFLFTNAPDEFATPEIAKHFTKGLETELPIGSFRAKGQKGAHPNRFVYSSTLDDPRTILERHVGPLAQYDGPEAKPVRPWGFMAAPGGLVAANANLPAGMSETPWDEGYLIGFPAVPRRDISAA